MLARLIPGAPLCVWKIIAMELMERFSYYGFRAILTLFFVRRLKMDEARAVAAFSLTSALAYASPVFGAWLADARLGRYATILSLGTAYCAGMWCLVGAAAVTSEIGALIALVIVGVGTGGIKPCVSSFGADQLGDRPGDGAALRRYFAVFYFSINLGSVASFLVVPVVRARLGYAAAFAVPAALLLVAIAVFAGGDYAHAPLKADGSVAGTLLAALRPGPPADGDAAALRSTLEVLALLPVFWMLYDQQGSVWVVQAAEMGDFDGAIQPEQMGVLNPILILILLPAFERYVYPALERRKVPISAPHRMAYGMVVAAASFFVAAAVDAALERGASLNVLWQAPQIFLITVAEILVSVTGLEYSYARAPESLRASVSALYLLTTAAGDVLGGALYATCGGRVRRSAILAACATLMLVTALAFRYVARRHFRADGDVRRRSDADAEDAVELAAVDNVLLRASEPA